MNKLLTIFALAAASTLAVAGGVYTATDHHRSGSHGDHHGMTDTTHAMTDADHAMLVGKPGDPAKVTRTVEVEMNDTMRFTPSDLKFKEGETVRFIVKNNGKIRHEMVIGTMGSLRAHGDMMRTDPTMTHNDPGTISLAPGETGELVWEFGKTGNLDFACLIPGHREAGMTGKIRVN